MSMRLSRSCLNDSGITAAPGPDPGFLPSELRLYKPRDLAHVGAARKARLEKRHDLAHVLDAACAGLRHGGGDRLRDFGLAHLLRQIGREHADLEFLRIRQVLARGL